MSKKNNKKIFIAWFSLIILLLLFLSLNYIKFFKAPNENIKEQPIETSSSKAIETALGDIVKNFNNDIEIKNYNDKNIKINAVLNQYSIFITYTTNNTTTYEFTYNNLNLRINVNNDKENIDKFNQIYSILLKAIQKRLNNESEDLDEVINDIINQEQTYEGIIKVENEKTNYYQIDITKKIIENNKISTEQNSLESLTENNLE